MNGHRLDLRSRVALAFAAFGAMVGLLMALSLMLATHDLGLRLIDETLNAELDDFFARRERNPHSLPPRTVTLHGYVRGPESNPAELPHYLATLTPGRHDLIIGELSYRVAVADRKESRYYFLYDASLQQKREQRFIILIAISILVIVLISAVGGFWLVGLVIAPVTELARRVKHRQPDVWALRLADDFSHDEVGELAHAFDLHLARIRAFMERERAFTADLSHELRTSLAVILGAVEILLIDETLSEKQKSRVARVERAARDMAEMGSALLLMAREERSWSLEEQACVAEVITEAVEKHRFLLKNKPIRITLQTDPTLHLTADRGLLFIALANLIRNAFAYTDQGTIDIVQDGSSVLIRDSGRGLRARHTDTLLPRHLSNHEGSGIGLTLVKRICDRYGWSLELTGQEEIGTTALIRFSAA
ncbi:MAG: HAMP domain-containing histidine kinase [Magnetococcales bacterium]|nr:HAMP domain-containing histidine kinase [Magnetococcales bacterium]